jgi:hypothetical protein
MRKPAKASKTQSERFIEAAREAGCSEDEAVFDGNLKRIAQAKSNSGTSAKPKQ